MGGDAGSGGADGSRSRDRGGPVRTGHIPLGARPSRRPRPSHSGLSHIPKPEWVGNLNGQAIPVGWLTAISRVSIGNCAICVCACIHCACTQAARTCLNPKRQTGEDGSDGACLCRAQQGRGSRHAHRTRMRALFTCIYRMQGTRPVGGGGGEEEEDLLTAYNKLVCKAARADTHTS